MAETPIRGPYGSEPQPRIHERCPACGASIFIAAGGYLTCTNLSCPEPGVGKSIEKLVSGLADWKHRALDLEQKLAGAVEHIADLRDSEEFRERTHRAQLDAAMELYLEQCRAQRRPEPDAQDQEASP